MVTLRDVFSRTTNKCNYQESFHPKKRILKKLDINIDDILNIKLKDKTKW